LSRRWAPASLALALFLLPSCSPTRTGGDDLDAPIFGSARKTQFVVSPQSGEAIHARDLATVARVLRRYKTLSEAERALVKTKVAARLNALISLEVTRLNREFRVERAAINRLPDRAAAARRLAELDARLQREAAARVIQRLGQLLAVPLKTSDNRSAVAFARIGAGGVEVAKDAGEVDRPIAALTNGERVQSAKGSLATLVAAESPVAVAAPK
jgi:hypothetical protein